MANNQKQLFAYLLRICCMVPYTYNKYLEKSIDQLYQSVINYLSEHALD